MTTGTEVSAPAPTTEFHIGRTHWQVEEWHQGTWRQVASPFRDPELACHLVTHLQLTARRMSATCTQQWRVLICTIIGGATR